MDAKEKPCTLAELKGEIDTLKVLIMYIVGCQAAIESILEREGLTTHKQVNAVALASMEKQKILMTEALNKLKEISDPI